MNMAIDEVLFENAKTSSLRLYLWDHPALSFGYFGKFADVADESNKRDLVRRWTGGGIVLHGTDLTYSIIIPASDSAFKCSTMSIYEAIHGAIREALGATGQHAELATVAAVCDRRSKTDSALTERRYNQNECFANPVRADVLLNGEKIAGAAQRKTRAGLLQQGSIQSVDLDEGFSGRFAAQLAPICHQRRLNGAVIERAHEIAAQKYCTEKWLRRR
jgi:lipoate-protein ligase A